LGQLGKSEIEKVKILVTILPSGKSYYVGIPTNWTVEKFLIGFKRKINKNDEAPMLATLKRDGKELDPTSTFRGEGIIDGDVILLREHVVGG